LNWNIWKTQVNDLSEKEQLQEIRAWWSENGRFVVAGVVLGIAAIFSWNQWRSSIEENRIEASNLFEEIMVAAFNGDLEAAEVAAGELFDNYEQTVYPEQARLALARIYMDKGRDQDAADALRELIVPGDETETQMVGRLRLAKVLLYQGKPDEVIALLKDRAESGFAARYNEVLGDAYVAEGAYAEAQAAYEAALSENPALSTVDNHLIQLKLNDLPDETELAETSAAIEAAIDEGEVAEEADDAADEPAESEVRAEVPPDSGTEQ
jgi:predicted negative regulator of RcsB-dependent stress response